MSARRGEAGAFEVVRVVAEPERLAGAGSRASVIGSEHQAQVATGVRAVPSRSGNR